MILRNSLRTQNPCAKQTAIAWGISALFLVALAGCATGPSSTTVSSTFDTEKNKFAPCPDSPNCVSTYDSDTEHAIEPYSYSGSATDAQVKLVQILTAMPRVSIQQSEDNYIHVEFRSRIFRFVDDVEFFIDDAAKQIHFRSAARLGYSDMGVNRKRMEEIRQKFVE